MLVSDIMTRTPRTVSPDAKLQEVASIMCLYRIPALPVVDADGKLVGNISEMDLLKNLFPTMEDITTGDAAQRHDDQESYFRVTGPARAQSHGQDDQ